MTKENIARFLFNGGWDKLEGYFYNSSEEEWVEKFIEVIEYESQQRQALSTLKQELLEALSLRKEQEL